MSTSVVPSIWLTMTCTGKVSALVSTGRRSKASKRLDEKSLRSTAATVSRTGCASTNQSYSNSRRRLRLDQPSTSPNAALANTQCPSGCTTATNVARWSNAAYETAALSGIKTRRHK